MAASKLTISPRTKVGELFEAYPELESVLMSMSPAFEKLKNPVLRKTVARVATLQQVSVVGRMNIEEMIRQLRKAAGQSYGESPSENPEEQPAEEPEWLDMSGITYSFNATPAINSGGSPMKEIIHQAGILKSGEILELQTPFIPVPIIDMLKLKGYKIHTIVNNDRILTYIIR